MCNCSSFRENCVTHARTHARTHVHTHMVQIIISLRRAGREIKRENRANKIIKCHKINLSDELSDISIDFFFHFLPKLKKHLMGSLYIEIRWNLGFQ